MRKTVFSIALKPACGSTLTHMSKSTSLGVSSASSPTDLMLSLPLLAPSLSKDSSVELKTSNSDSPPPVIPPEHGNGRTLVLCFDGTRGQFDGDNSNVVQFVSLLEKGNRNNQLVYYQVRINLACFGFLELIAFRGRLGLAHTPRRR